MKKLELNITEVENGYVVHDSSGLGRGAVGKTYVAVTRESLAQLVCDLAKELHEELPSNGPIQKP